MKIDATGIAREGVLRPVVRKCFLIMKLTMLLLVVALLQVSAKGLGQITLDVNNVPIKKVLSSISKQTGYFFFYNNDILKDEKVSAKLSNATLEQTLALCLNGLPYTYRILDKNVVITRIPVVSPVPSKTPPADTIQVQGRIIDEKNIPVSGATVRIKGSS